MQILNGDFDFKKFCEKLKDDYPKALLMDYDGTLAPFQDDPSLASPYPGVEETIDRIMRNENVRVVLITGRWTKDITPLLNLEKFPEIWGTHGLERLKPNGSYQVAKMDEKALVGLAEADHWLSSPPSELRVRYDQKPGSLAIHWRGLKNSQIKKINEKVKTKFLYLSKKYGLLLKEFDGGLELRVPGKTKGDAVNSILSEMPRKTISAYLGDDNTDEDAFTAIKGKGIGVLVRSEIRPTKADVWLEPPHEMLDFLSKWVKTEE